MSLLRLLVFYARAYIPLIVASIVLQLASVLGALMLPALNAQIIDQGIATGDTGYILRTGALMLSLALLQVFAAVGAVFFGAKTAMSIGRDIRGDVFEKVTELSTIEVSQFGAGTLITRGTNDVQQVQMLALMTLNFMVTAPIMAVGGVVMALREDAGLSWLVWLSVLLLGVIVSVMVSFLIPLFRTMQDKIDRINGILREQIMGIRVVRAFVREHYESRRYRNANEDLTRVSVRVGNIFVLMFPVIMMVLHAATGAVLWFGAFRVDEGLVAVGSLTAFMQYLIMILTAVMMGVFMVMMVPRAMVCAERITELQSTQARQNYPIHPAVETPRQGEVRFEDVTFGFPGAELPVISNASFTIHAGETTAIIGSTGSGKSTLLGLMLRLFDPQEGRITVDGQPLPTLTQAQLAETFAMVPQRPYLFSGTVASNLRFGNEEATEAELWSALAVAQAKDFVERMPGQLDTPVAQGGTSVSGGQRQRLSIARALVAAPLVYLFDDSFSALDTDTDARLRKALGEHTHGATNVIVAQRVSTIMSADRILVLEGGKVVGEGTHSELLATNEVYQEIVASQLEVSAV